jgi:hypothetical protein
MSNLASFSVINEKVEKIYREDALENKGAAFTILSLKTLFKLTDEEVEESITDGPMDGELDAVYISDRTINLLTFKYTDRFDLSQKNYPETELDQFILTVDSIISGNLDEKTINNAIWDKYQEIRELSKTGKIEFKVFVVSNKLHPVDHAKLKLKNSVEKYRIVDDPIYIDQEDFVSIILENKTERVDGGIRFIDKQHFEKSDGNIRTIIGSVAGTDLINLIKIDDEKVNENVFNENIRVYKPKHRVNKAIVESAKSDSNFEFFYLNNGVTILCQNLDYAPNTRSPLVELTNFQVINGGQTSHSLFEVFKSKPEKIDSIEVLVRICEVKSENPLSDKISETSNNQIPVGNRDLHSNDIIQRKLEEDFKTLGYFYERKPNQYMDEDKKRVLNNEVLGQLFMAYHLDMPSEAKNSKTKVFSELYDQIFDEMVINASDLLRLYYLYLPLLQQKKTIQKKKRKKEPINEREAFVSRAIFHILNGAKLFFEKEINIIESKDTSSVEKKKEVEILYKTKGNDFISQSTSLIYEVVQEQMGLRGDLYTHDKFFKEIPTNSLVKNHILKSLNK